MTTSRQFLIAIVVLGVMALLRFFPAVTGASKTVGYHGQQIKLTKAYATYEEYEDDIDNAIDPSEYAHVADLVTHVQVPRTFSNRSAFIHAILDAEFPGFGAAFSGISKQPDGSVLELAEIDIPHTPNARYFTYRVHGDAYTLIDEFIAPADPLLTAPSDQPDGTIAYHSTPGAVLMTRAPFATKN